MDLRDNQGLTPVETGSPINAITLDLTKRCVLACDYCFAHCFNKDGDKADLDLDTGYRAVEWLLNPSTRGDSKEVDISFWGGEPLVRFDTLQKIVEYAERRGQEEGVAVTFNGTTNVVLLTEEKFDFLEQHNCHFLLSIDGRQINHDMHRKFPNGKGSWEIVDANATKILEQWPFYKVRLSFSVETIDTFLDDLKYLHGKGFKEIVYSPVAEGNWTPERIATLKEMWYKIADWYIDLYKSGNPVEIKYISDGCKQLISSPMGNAAPCGAGIRYVGITTDGSIYPCHRFNKMDDCRPWYEKETCIGHIDYGIINYTFRNRFTQWIPENTNCQRCHAFKLSCTGGCWATNHDVNSDIASPVNINCILAQHNLTIASYICRKLGPAYTNQYIKSMSNGGLKQLIGSFNQDINSLITT